MTQKEAAIHRSKLRDGPFRLNLHPRDYFQGNPYRGDKPLPPASKPLPAAQKVSVVPFKPPSPSKKVIILYLLHNIREISGEKSLADHSVTLTQNMSARLEEWRRGHLTLIPHILLIRTSCAAPNRPVRSRSSALLLVLRAYLSRVSSLSMLTGLIPAVSIPELPFLCSHIMEGFRVTQIIMTSLHL